MEHYAWTVALTRMISAVFRRGGDVSFVVEELKAVFDPRGGHWMGGRYIPSLLAAIGEVIEKHMITIGFLKTCGQQNVKKMSVQLEVASNTMVMGAKDTKEKNQLLRQCPKCSQFSLIQQEGCDSCISCNYSKCG